MCGIAGILHLDGSARVDEAVLHAMNDTLVHRGPDDAGQLVDGAVGLAMRRLSIIDLASGRQPVSNEDGTVSVVFNGEIYTYREVAARLRARGHRFSTTSDTEVIVHLYEDHGAACVEHLRGMFAFALWDAKARTLLVARDRLGIKPLYYGVFDGTLVFGSEMKAVLRHPSAARGVDLEALSAYLRFGYVPDPLTILDGIRKLRPGHVLVARAGEIQERPYWDLGEALDATAPNRSEAELRDELDARLRESIRLHLVSDVPVGAFLSGGIDSSTIVALSARELESPLQTFSIGFRDERFDELPHAREVARQFGTDHHELVLEPSGVDEIRAIVRHFDEPFGDPAALPTYFVSKLAREHVKVVLSGDGGDEVFGGYERYVEHVDRDFAEAIPATLRRWGLGGLSRLLPEGAPGKRLLHNLSLTGIARYLDSISYLSSAEQATLLCPEALRSFDSVSFGNGRREGRDSLAEIMLVDFRTYLPGDILTKTDRMSMAHSVEARVPFLDHELVEWAAKLPRELKVAGGSGKVLLKSVAERYLPAKIVHRPKHGFAVPLQAWFAEDLGSFLRELLTDRRTRERGVLRPEAVTALVDDERSLRSPHRLWLLAMLEMWFRAVVDR